MKLRRLIPVVSQVVLIAALAGLGVAETVSDPDSSSSYVVLEPLGPMDQMKEHAPPTTRESAAEITTRFRPPLLAHDWSRISAYVDIDDASPGILDYECDDVTYDGHNGNDIAIRDFVDQDEGRYVVAAAPGIVVATADGYFDRHTVAVPGTPSNYVTIQHDDGSSSVYYHLRKWSVMVHPGQQVLEGQPLGLVGSSGISRWPHLHFGVYDAGSVMTEPHWGGCRPGDSLWQNQQPHATGNPVALVHAGMTTNEPSSTYPSGHPMSTMRSKSPGARCTTSGFC